MSFQHEGEHVQKSTKCTNKREAETYERAYRTQLAKGEVGIEPKTVVPVFSSAMSDFLKWVEVEHIEKPNTVRSYISTSKALVSYFGSVKVNRITSGEVEKFKQWRSVQPKKPRTDKKRRRTTTTKGNVSPATVNRSLAVLKIFFNHMIKSGYVDHNPVSRVKMLTETPPPIRVLSDDDERLYLMAASQPLQDIATILVDTGMRPEEVFRLRKEFIDLDRGSIFNPKGKTRYAKRYIPLTRRVKAILERLHISHQDEHYFARR